MTTIEFEHVDFQYPSGQTVLNDISIKIDSPGLYCIIGPNGVGKSTFVKCMNKLLKPTRGRITIDGKDLADMKNKEIAQYIGYVPPISVDVFSMPVIDTILIGRHNQQKWRTSQEDIAIVHRAMDMLDLEQLAMRGYNELSAGQHQRVSIARGLVQETPVLILDEPTANLDVKHQVYVTELLRILAEQNNLTIIMICHDLNIAARYANRIIVMAPPGVIKCSGPPSEVITKEIISEIYGIDCDIITVEDSPLVILKSTFGPEEDE